MNTIQRFSIAVAASLVGVSSAFAMTMVPKSEPMNGFTRGENPEWTTINTDSKDFDMRHREYQRDAEAERILWLRTNESMMGTPEYTEAKRQFLQHRNLMHRLWVLEQTKGMRPVSLKKPSVKTEPMMPSVVTPETSINSRTYSGNAPSRREIVRSTDDRNKVRAITVGY